jgi:hypothetical protein
MKTYRGHRGPAGCVVTVDGQTLRLRLDLRNHSPTGFEWGYGGWPAQLALAILADALGDEAALKWYQRFKFAVVAALPAAEWTLTAGEVRRQVAMEAYPD